MASIFRRAKQYLLAHPWEAAWGFGLLLLAGLLRGWQLGRDPLWYDEVMYTRLCQTFSWDIAASRSIRIEPAFYLFLWAWEKLGHGEAWLRLHSLLSGLGVVGMAMLMGRDVAGRRGAWFCGMLCATGSFLVFYSRDAKMYSWVALAEISLVYLAVRFADSNGTRCHLVLYAILAAILVHTHVLSAIFLAVLNVVYLVLFGRTLRKTAAWLAAQACVALAVAPFLIAQRHLAGKMGEVIFWAPIPTLRSLWIGYSNLLMGYPAELWVRAVGVCLLTGLIALSLSTEGLCRKRILFLLGAGAGNMLGFYILSKSAPWPMYVDRYMIGSAPLFLIAAGAGLASVPSRWLRLSLAAALIVPLAVSLRDLYEWRLPPDPQEHLGVLRAIDPRAIASAIRREAQPGDAVWHLAWDADLTTQWYLPEAEHVAIEMTGEMSAALARDEIASRAGLYGFRAMTPEAARQGVRRVWLIVPESQPPVYARFYGIVAWLDARARCLRHESFGGRYADASLYCYEFLPDSQPTCERPSAELPIIGTGPDGRSGRLGEIQVEIESQAQAQIRNMSDTVVPLHYEVVASDCACEAASFNRALGAQSRWALQLYSDSHTARVAYRTGLNRRVQGNDTLETRAVLAAGEYDVFIERITSPDGPLAAPIIVRVGTQAFEASGRAEHAAEGWQWVYLGNWSGDGGDAALVTVAPDNPDRKPEVIPVFSRIVFVRKGENALTSPVLTHEDVTLQPRQTLSIDLRAVLQGRRTELIVSTTLGSGCVSTAQPLPSASPSTNH